MGSQAKAKELEEGGGGLCKVRENRAALVILRPGRLSPPKDPRLANRPLEPGILRDAG